MDEEFTPLDLLQRPRRLRKSHSIRALVQEHWLRKEDLIQPIFVTEGEGAPKAINSMPDIYRFPLDHLIRECEELSSLDIKAVALFPSQIPSNLKTNNGKEALNPQNIIIKAIKAIKKNVPELIVVTDIALDPYTTHGHDGVLSAKGTDVDNDKTVDILCQMAALHAEAGADFVAPSDMMDGRIGAIRTALDEINKTEIGIIAYTAKYNSAFYGPFREAVGSAKKTSDVGLSKATYQMNPANRAEAIIEAELDEAEGADIIMVKPAGPYLDVIREVRNSTNLPVAAYQVSGEYAQMHAAASNGWLNLERIREESLLSIKRAGANMIFTYFAKAQASAMKNNGL